MKALNESQPILGGIGIRGLVEAVCRQKRAKGNNLEKRIDDLVTKGLLTANQAKLLHKLRHLGNAAAHEAKPPSSNVLTAAMNVAEHLLKIVYVLPAVARELSSEKKKA